MFFFIYKEKQHLNVETITSLHLTTHCQVLGPIKGTVVYTEMPVHHSVYTSPAVYYLLKCFHLY